jgi:CubicO group peptidase (beta-lactamase class C family)
VESQQVDGVANLYMVNNGKRIQVRMQKLKSERSSEKLIATLTEQVPALMVNNNVPGLSMAILRSADLFWSGVFGVQSNITKEPVTQETVFEAASLSKPVFAYAVLKLCEDKKLVLDVPLVEYLPDPYIPDEPRVKLLTLRHVLSHSTGFPNWRPEGKPLKMYFTPGERFSYSGEGYQYLQTVVEHIIGKNLPDYMLAEFLQPLGMNNSRFVWTGDENLSVAVGHAENGEAKEKYLWKEMNAAASLHSTPNDFANFMCAVMRPIVDHPAHLGVKMAGEILKEQIKINDSVPWDDDWPKPEITTSDLAGWGLGWGIQHTGEGDSIWHWGDNGNYRAFALGDPNGGHGFVIMTNGKKGQKVINSIMKDIIGGEYPGVDLLHIA